MTESVLVINAGSSSVKFQLFAVSFDDQVELRTKGQIDGIGTRPRINARSAEGRVLVDQQWPASEVPSIPSALDRSIPFLREQIGGPLPAVVAHRGVHRGPGFDAPTFVDARVLERLDEVDPLAAVVQ